MRQENRQNVVVVVVVVLLLIADWSNHASVVIGGRVWVRVCYAVLVVSGKRVRVFVRVCLACFEGGWRRSADGDEKKKQKKKEGGEEGKKSKKEKLLRQKRETGKACGKRQTQRQKGRGEEC